MTPLNPSTLQGTEISNIPAATTSHQSEEQTRTSEVFENTIQVRSTNEQRIPLHLLQRICEYVPNTRFYPLGRAKVLAAFARGCKELRLIMSPLLHDQKACVFREIKVQTLFNFTNQFDFTNPTDLKFVRRKALRILSPILENIYVHHGEDAAHELCNNIKAHLGQHNQNFYSRIDVYSAMVDMFEDTVRGSDNQRLLDAIATAKHYKSAYRSGDMQGVIENLKSQLYFANR